MGIEQKKHSDVSYIVHFTSGNYVVVISIDEFFFKANDHFVPHFYFFNNNIVKLSDQVYYMVYRTHTWLLLQTFILSNAKQISKTDIECQSENKSKKEEMIKFNIIFR